MWWEGCETGAAGAGRVWFIPTCKQWPSVYRQELASQGESLCSPPSDGLHTPHMHVRTHAHTAAWGGSGKVLRSLSRLMSDPY